MTSTPSQSSPAVDRSLHLQCSCTLLVAVGAAYVSYLHGREFALRFGADATTATIWPLIVDGLLTMATVELWKTGNRAHAAGQWKAWLSFALGIGLSLCANIASAPELNIFSIAVAICPPLALLLSVELLSQALKRRHAEAAEENVHEPEEADQEQSPSKNSAETATALETPQQAQDLPVLRTVADNVPGHSVTNADPESRSSHRERDDPLRETAYRLDAEHRLQHQRPISADTLRRNLRVGSARARTLTRDARQRHRPEPAR